MKARGRCSVCGKQIALTGAVVRLHGSGQGGWRNEVLRLAPPYVQCGGSRLPPVADDGAMLSAVDLARELAVSVSTLVRWRNAGTGPAFYLLGSSIRYARADVDAWLAGRRRDPLAPTPVTASRRRYAALVRDQRSALERIAETARGPRRS